MQVATASDSWTPNDIDLWAWYDASDSSSITHSANAVSDWVDKSLNGRDLSQATAANKPSTNTRTLNSLNVIDFDGNDYLSETQFQLSGNGSICVFMVAVIDAVDNNDDCMFSFDTGGTAVLRFRAGAQPEFEGDIVSSSGTDPTQTGADFKGPSIYMVNVDFSRNAIYGYVDGTRITDSEEANTSVANPVDFNVFANQNATDIPDGACAEIVVVISPTSVERLKIEGYLAHKWGLEANLPSGHPYKTSAP